MLFIHHLKNRRRQIDHHHHLKNRRRLVLDISCASLLYVFLVNMPLIFKPSEIVVTDKS